MPTVAVEGQFRFVVNTRKTPSNRRTCMLGWQRGRLPDRVERRRLHGPASSWQLPGHHAGVRETRSGDQGDLGRHPQEVANGRGAGEKRQPDDDHRSLLDDGIELSFADGLRGLIPYGEVPEVGNREGISGLELPNPYEMVLQTAKGVSVEIPWDFARHYCDATYRPTIEAIAALGGRPSATGCGVTVSRPG